MGLEDSEPVTHSKKKKRNGILLEYHTYTLQARESAK